MDITECPLTENLSKNRCFLSFQSTNTIKDFVPVYGSDDNKSTMEGELIKGEPHMHLNGMSLYLVSQKKKRPAFERLLLPEYISNDILQY